MSREEVDRIRELANIGAGHAATAFAQLAGREVRMGVPEVREVDADLALASDSVSAAWASKVETPRDGATGVFFELSGCMDALFGILFTTPECEAAVRCLLGRKGELAPEEVQSVLMELGNILASHVANAIADTLGDRLLPSLPSLVMGSAERELQSRAAHGVVSARGGIQIECELSDGRGELGGLLVLVPTGYAAEGHTPERHAAGGHTA